LSCPAAPAGLTSGLAEVNPVREIAIPEGYHLRAWPHRTTLQQYWPALLQRTSRSAVL